MSFYREDYAKIKQLYIEKKKSAVALSEARIKKLCEDVPEYKYIDDKISSLGVRIYEAALNSDDYEKSLSDIKAEMKELLRRQSQILSEKGYPQNYLDVNFECAICSDEGNVNGKMCICMKKKLIEAGYVTAGISSICKKMNFDTFDLSYYTGTAKENAAYVYEKTKQFAENFNGENCGSLLFMGGTGLGKTHLSVAVAKRVIENGFYVIYDTAENIFEDFNYERFRRSYNDGSACKTDKYFECDLLVLDDLGTEVKSNAVTSFLYNLINTRINAGKSTFISTNLNQSELLSAYDERVISRLFGEFLPYVFEGKDVRMQKLKKK